MPTFIEALGIDDEDFDFSITTTSAPHEIAMAESMMNDFYDAEGWDDCLPMMVEQIERATDDNATGRIRMLSALRRFRLKHTSRSVRFHADEIALLVAFDE